MTTTHPAGQGPEQAQHPGGHREARGGGVAGGQQLTVRARYFAGAAAAAGVEEELVALPTGADVRALRAAMVRRHPALERVLAVATLLVDEVSTTSGDLALRDGALVDVLPPFAGG